MKQYTAPLISLIVLLVSGAVFSWMLISIHAANSTVKAIGSDVQAVQGKEEAARSMELFLDSIAPLRTSLETYVPQEEDVVVAIELIEATARRERVSLSLSSVNIVPKEEWVNHEGVSVKFSVIGSFTRVAAFAASLETLPLASKVESASFSATLDGEWFASFDMFFVQENYE